MSILKYRGKSIDTGKFKYGGALENEMGQVFIISIESVLIDPETNGYDLETNFYEVDPETVGQCTALEDDDKLKLFKGDLVKCCLDNGIIFETRIQEVPDPLNFPQMELFLRMFNAIGKNTKIGNKYDNPELMEK